MQIVLKAAFRIETIDQEDTDAAMQHGEPAATTLWQLRNTKLGTIEIQF